MKKIVAYLHLARPLNLLIVAITQLLFWFYIVEPVYHFFSLEPNLNFWQVAGLVLSTVLIAAGGYAINDYYDLPIDLVNKPEKVIVSKDISDEAAFNYYVVVTALGLISALAVALSMGKVTLILLPFIMASALWFYAQEFKRGFVVGNLVVAICTAAVIFILLLFEVDWKLNSVQLEPEINEILKFGLGYMVFAFLMTMLREVVKDLQDREGDAQFDCRTLPVVWGVLPAKIFALLWLGIVLVAIGWLSAKIIGAGNIPAAAYLLGCIAIPGLVIGYKIIVASASREYKSISNWIKAMMIFGILTMIYIGVILGKHG